MAHYNLMDPSELAELGLASDNPLAQALGASLQDYIEELTDTADAMHEARASARVYQYQVIPPLHAEIARLTAALAEKA